MIQKIKSWWRGNQRCLVCERPRKVHIDLFHGPCLATYDDFVRVAQEETP